MFYNARYYSPYLNRFVSADTIVPELGNPQAFNRYSYTINNPLKHIDPSGHTYLCDEKCEANDGRPLDYRPKPYTKEWFRMHSGRHYAIQLHFVTVIRPGADMEVPIRLGGQPDGRVIGRADLVYGNEIWEVKPGNNRWTQGVGQAQLSKYIANTPRSRRGDFIPTFRVPYYKETLVVRSDDNQPGMLYYTVEDRRPQYQPAFVPVPQRQEQNDRGSQPLAVNTAPMPFPNAPVPSSRPWFILPPIPATLGQKAYIR
jgi:hypothetical protein